MLDLVRDIAEAFDLGTPSAVESVTGGLSNDLWKVETAKGVFAVKVMRVNAASPNFRSNIESAYAIEAKAFGRGIHCPEPITSPDGGCLAAVGGQLARVHRWCDGQPPRPLDWQKQAGELLARIHGVGEPFDHPLDDEPWDAHKWAGLAGHADMPTDLANRLRRAAPDLAALEAVTAANGRIAVHIPSHGDLDPKNTLVVGDQLMALDWDAARIQPAMREAVSVALDWSTDAPGFRRVLTSYLQATDATIVAEPWVFGGWVAAQGGWLIFNATARVDTGLGQGQVAQACDRLHALHASLATYLQAVRSA